MIKANVITVMYNNVKTLDGFFEGIRAQGDTVAKVVLVDNDSTDATLAKSRQLAAECGLDIVVVSHTNAGFAGGYARGGKEALDRDLPTLCLNPDVSLAPGTLGVLLEALNGDNQIGIATAPLITETGELDAASRRLLPSLRKASLYAILGKFTPRKLRYNGQDPKDTTESHVIEATTGALMLIAPAFRPAALGIFDQAYWMYGEDLQICLDARNEGWGVVMVKAPPSIHLKGSSSGRPRGDKSNIAFHRAMFTYYQKNLNVYPIGKIVVGGAIFGRLAVQLCYSRLHRSTNWARAQFVRNSEAAK